MDLHEWVASCKYDPLKFVEGAFDWGVGSLEGQTGPDEWQKQRLIELGEELYEKENNGGPVRMATASGHGIGKAQSYSLLVPTPTGERRWGDIQPGDFLFGKDGNPTRVVARHEQGVRPIYRVTFDDGSSTLVDEEHLWSVKGRQQRRLNQPWTTLTTREIAEKGVKRSNGSASARQWEIPQHSAAQFETRPVTVDAYTLGCWLGDGSANSGSITSADPEMMERIGATKLASKYSYSVPGLYAALKELGIAAHRCWEKSIPDEYKYNDVAVRRDVLAGLLDTDGEVAKQCGAARFTSTSRTLAEDVAWLVRSLGGKARVKGPKQKGYKKNGEYRLCRDVWETHITIRECPFKLERKAAAWRPASEERYHKRWIESIEYSHDEEAMCVTVEAEDSLYLTNDFIVTHNSALVSWVVLFYMATRPDCLITVTANTENQLKTKTWRELAKWWKLSITRSWFKWEKMSFRSVERPETWVAHAIPWSENNSEAFAGQHEKYTMVLMDEASGISNIIWQVASGALTTPGAVHLAFGNPTRPSGYFYDCFHKLSHRWNARNIDSRTAKMADGVYLQELVDDFGEDSDYVRVRVLGQFPRQSSRQAIPRDVVEQAAARKIPYEEIEHYPLVMGVDVARYGDDKTVIIWRKGPKILDIQKFPKQDVIQTAKLVSGHLEKHRKRREEVICFIDEIGVGGGVVDYLRHSRHDNIVGVMVSRKAVNERTYYNLRAELWLDNMLEWLHKADIPDDKDLIDELTGCEYSYQDRTGQQVLERKDDMKKRGLLSPDAADAIAITFAAPSFSAPQFEDDEDYEEDYTDDRDDVTGY
jgi:hypothetical protein